MDINREYIHKLVMENRWHNNIYNFLTQKGLKPKYDDDRNIIFKQEGDIYHIFFREDDDDFTSLRKINQISIEDDDELFDIYEVLNDINSKYIVGKCCLVNDNKIISFNIDYFGSADEFLNYFEKFLAIINHMEEDFYSDDSDESDDE